MRVLVCGGRNYGHVVRTCGHTKDEPLETQERLKEYDHIFNTLNKLSLEWPKSKPDDLGNWLPDVCILSGGSTGVDTVAIDWAVVNWCPWMEFKPDWEKHGRAAGPIRNQQMLDEGKPDLVVAFPGGKGTDDMVRRAKEAGVEVIEVDSP